MGFTVQQAEETPARRETARRVRIFMLGVAFRDWQAGEEQLDLGEKADRVFLSPITLTEFLNGLETVHVSRRRIQHIVRNFNNLVRFVIHHNVPKIVSHVWIPGG